MAIKQIGNSIIALTLSIISLGANAFEDIDYEQYFPDVVQGHHGASGSCQNNGSQLVIYNGEINGTNGQALKYCSSNKAGNSMGDKTCDDGGGDYDFCDITGSDIDGIDFSAASNQFLESSGTDGIAYGECESQDNWFFGPDTTQYRKVVLDKAGCSLTFDSGAATEYRIKDFILDKDAVVNLPAGDYWIEKFTINGGTPTFNITGDVRFFVKDNANLSGALTINEIPDSRFTLISYNNFTFNDSGVEFNGYIYSDGNIIINGDSTFNGRITSKNLTINNETTINDASFDPVPAPFHIQYGKSTSTSITDPNTGVITTTGGSVKFTTPFPDGSTPLIFLMPTISETNTNNDKPVTAVLVPGSVSTAGFNWEIVAPPNSNTTGSVMPEIHWIAVTEGTHELSNGTELIAGTVEQDEALIGSNSPYVNVTLPSTQNVLLNQLQTQNNDCWFTSTSQFNGTGIQLAMDTSEVRRQVGNGNGVGNRRCMPADLNNNQIVAETIAYLTVEAGTGSGNDALVLNGESFNYHFGKSQTFTAANIQNLASQCAFTTPLIGFTEVPILVAGKNSRRGGDGGWLRRCQLTNDIVSMAIDEDTYRDSDRSHIWENYSFLALEKVEPITQCFTDDFNRSDVGDDWVVSESRGGFIPAIVNSRLRITEAAGNQATSSTYQRLFPAADNLVTIEFDHYAYGGSGADGIAFVLSDASITPQPGSYGGPLGYGARSNVDGFAGGWLGFGIDEYGNFSTEGGPGGPGRRQQSVAVRGSGSGTSGYDYLRGTCNNGQDNPNGDCLSPTVDNNENSNHRYRITVDSQVAGQSMVSVERDTGDGNGYVMLISPFDAASEPNQSDVPTDFLLSLTGSTGGATNNHEIDNVEICALDSNPIGVVIDHFEFTHTGAALTCNAEPMTLKACANEDCSDTVPDFVTATLSPATIAAGGGWVGGNVVGFSGGSTNLELRNNTAGAVTVDVTGSTPGAKPFSTTLCSVAGNTPTAAQCTFNFADSGFIFDVPDKLANKATGVINISAVEKDSETLECVPQFADVTKSVGFWSDYVEPSTVISGQNVSVTGSGTATSIGTSVGARTPINLDFDSNGIAEIDVNYPDAGQIQLNAQYDGTGDEDGLVMVGADSFVSFPIGLCVTPVDANASCAAGNSTCAVYKKAGEEFELTIQGKAWESDGDLDYCDNLSTPNYVHAGMTLASSLVAPSPGEAGVIGLTSYDHVAATNNSNDITQSISEVGVFEFTVKPDSSYLGSSFYDIPLASSGNIGRFIPDRFVISGVSVLPACSVFNYMDQPFSMAMNISAFNTGSEVTKNYKDNFAKATALLVGEDSQDGDDKRNRLSALPVSASSWVAGVATVDSSYMATLSRLTAPNKDGPYEDMDIGVVIEDNDGGNSLVADPDMNAATSGTCGSNCDAKQITNQRFRHGRVVMDNTYGAENDTLQMPTRAEYWDGTNWVVNILDNCTIVTPALVKQTDDVSLGYQFEPSLTAGQAIARTGESTSFSAGEFTLLWNAIITGSAADYRGQVTAPLIVPDWLQWYWNWDNASSITLYDPRASAYFGRYRGHDRIIYWREKR